MYKNKGEKQKKMEKKNAISLIVLVITIIVMAILAATVIITLSNTNIIEQAQESKNATIVASEKQELSVALAEWKIVETQGTKTFEEFMKEKFGEENVIATGEDKVTVTMESGNKYNVTKDGTITSAKGINLNKSTLILELDEEKTLTASLNGITGEITWSNSDSSKATISAATGESITVTAKEVGITTITAKCGSYTATCTVTVKEAVAIGSYVKYDMPYIDMYSNIEYTETTGWRYLGKDDAGNKLIVSTGIPAILYYHYTNNIENITDEVKNAWWATKAEISATTDTLYQTTKGYDYNTDDGEPNKYATYGLRYKFDKIPFTQQASGTSASTANAGIFKKVGNITSGTNINLNFKASGVDVVDVHNLTLAELNRATSKASGRTRTDEVIGSGFKDLTEPAKGLFDMKKLDGYTQSYYYWLASPDTRGGRYVCNVYYVESGGGNVYAYNNSNYGVRPVVTLSSDVQLVDTNSDGVLEIVK